MKKRIIILIFLLTSFNCCATMEPHGTSISFTGDIIMHIPVKSCAREQNIIDAATKESVNDSGFDFLFEKIRNSLKRSDEVVGNMEFPVSPPFTSLPMIFNCHPHVLLALKKAGFTVMHTANNHIFDQDAAGVISTMDFIKKSGLSSIGVGLTEKETRAGIVKDIKGIKIGFIGYTDVLNAPIPRKHGGFAINLLNDKDAVTADIKRIRPLCDYLIMVVHAGDEYVFDPSEKTKSLLRFYIDRGVDLVVGHHPHVLQPAEAVTATDGRRCHIFYSLGNFISNQSSKHPLRITGKPLSTKDSIVLTVHLVRDDKAIKKYFTVEPITTVNYRPPGGKRVIQTVPMADVMAALAKKISGAEVPSPQEEWELKDMKERLGAITETIFRYGPVEEIRLIGR